MQNYLVTLKRPLIAEDSKKYYAVWGSNEDCNIEDMYLIKGRKDEIYIEKKNRLGFIKCDEKPSQMKNTQH